MQLNSLRDVFVDQMADLYNAEQQLVATLPRVAQAARSEELKEAFQEHLEQTQGHLRRLEQVFDDVGVSPPSKTCQAMQGILREGNEILEATGESSAKDAALIAAAQRVEHYEIAGYGTARALADTLGFDNARDMLDQTLEEESETDKRLTKIAMGGMLGSGINAQAAST